MSESTGSRRLPLRKVILGAFILPWEHRDSLFRATAVPLLAVIACALIGDAERETRSLAVKLTISGFYALAVSWLAVTVHRLVLLNERDPRPRIDAASLRRLAIFFGVLVVIWVLYMALTALIGGILLFATSSPWYIPTGTPPEPKARLIPFEWTMWIASFFACWFVGRVSLMLPAIAIDRKPDLVAAWRASRRNGWRLVIVVGVLPWCVQQFTFLLYRDGATPVEFALLVVLAAVLAIVVVVALSLSYSELTEPAPPPTPPPT